MGWYKKSNFQISVLSADSYGNLVLNVNGEIKKYILPYSAKECPSDIRKFIKQKNLSKYLEWLEQFRKKDKKDMDVGVGTILSKDECIPVIPAGI